MKFVLVALLTLSFSVQAKVIDRWFHVSANHCSLPDMATHQPGSCTVKFTENSPFERVLMAPKVLTITPAPWGKSYKLRFRGLKYGWRLDCSLFLNDRVGYVDCRRHDYPDAIRQLLKRHPELKDFKVVVAREE